MQVEKKKAQTQSLILISSEKNASVQISKGNFCGFTHVLLSNLNYILFQKSQISGFYDFGLILDFLV